MKQTKQTNWSWPTFFNSIHRQAHVRSPEREHEITLTSREQQHSPSVPDVIQHAYLQHLRGMVERWTTSGIRGWFPRRVESNCDPKLRRARGNRSWGSSRTEERGTAGRWPISTRSLTRGIKRYHVPEASNRTRVYRVRDPRYVRHACMHSQDVSQSVALSNGAALQWSIGSKNLLEDGRILCGLARTT